MSKAKEKSHPTDSEQLEWSIENATTAYDIPESVEISEDNCRDYIDYWVLAANGAANIKARLHLPYPYTARKSCRPLCDTPNGEHEWDDKDLPVYPWGAVCKKCLSLINGKYYNI